MNGSDIAQKIAPVVALARQGRFAEAGVAVQRLLAEGSDVPAVRALAGAIELQRQRYAPAADHLERAFAASQDAMVRRNLAEASHHLGRWERVLALVDLATAQAEPGLHLARLAGHAAQALGRDAEAIAFYRHVVATDPRDWTSWNNLGNAHAALGEAEAAEHALRRAIGIAPDARPTQLNLANLLILRARHDEAEAILAAMIRDDPQDPHPRYSLSRLLFERQREDDAQAQLYEAARLAPERADIQADLGRHALRLGLLERAETALRAAIALQPDVAETYVSLASTLELRNREGELPALRAAAVAAGIDADTIAFIDTLLARRQGDAAAALAALERAQPVLTPIQYGQIKGTLLDRLGRPDEAFACFVATNELAAADPSAPRTRAAAFRAGLAAKDALLTPAWLAGWTAPAAPEADAPAAPIFLLGFPRSGTTLLDTMLMSDPRVRVLEEERFIGDFDEACAGATALPALDAAALRAARADYFEKVRHTGPLTRDTILIDKHPMHGANVLAIHRLFPEARFILALRHPCDVLLSCLQTSFRINDAMASFLDLGDAAALYDLTFRHWQHARELCDLPVSTVVYEDLVEDPAAQLRPLFAELGLVWPEGGLDHRAAARARGVVKTASYAQVTEPVYRRSAGRWHAYARHLEPAFDLLRPWAERFGYRLAPANVDGTA